MCHTAPIESCPIQKELPLSFFHYDLIEIGTSEIDELVKAVYQDKLTQRCHRLRVGICAVYGHVQKSTKTEAWLREPVAWSEN